KVKVYQRGNVRDYKEAPIGAEGVLFEGEAAENPPVAVGNIVYVPPLDAEREIFVLGEVRNPGAYPLEPGRQARLLELIARAGGHDAVRGSGPGENLRRRRYPGFPGGAHRGPGRAL